MAVIRLYSLIVIPDFVTLRKIRLMTGAIAIRKVDVISAICWLGV